jgi:hypothetical protein
MCRFFSIGILAVTATYIGLVVALQFLAPECLDEPCYSEGVDNSIISWATDFFLALALFGFATHLAFAGSATRKSGILAQIFMAGAFTVAGIYHWLYANNGFNDGKGMVGFWIVWMIGSLFFTFSALAHAHFAQETTEKLSKLQKPCCADRLLGLCQLLIVGCCISNMIGCIWCAASPELRVNDLIDEFDDVEDAPTCIRLIMISEVLLYFCYALLWIPTGLLLKAAARQNSSSVLGLSTPIAAGSTVLFQWSVGAMYFVCLAFTAWIRGDEFLELYQKTYGAQVIHYGMLMTFFCAHNLAWTLTIPKKLVVPEQKGRVNMKKVVPSDSQLASKVNEAEKGIMTTKMQQSEKRLKELLERKERLALASKT